VRRRAFASSLAAAFACGGATPAAAFVPKPTSRERLATRAEATAYREASRASDVARILTELDARGAPIARGSIGTTSEGRDIPYVVASRPMVRSVAEARALGRPIVFVQAALDASQVEGTDALVAMIRDLCLSTQKTLLEEIVLVAVPLVNVDASERPGPGLTNAPEQDGPEAVGTRANARGIDLTNDFVVAAAAETRALLGFLNLWQPDVFVDLSSDGATFDAFGATYAPALHPAASRTGTFVRDVLLPSVRNEMRDAFALETFSFGGFGRSRALLEPPPPGDPDYGWFAGDYRPRVATNYMGLRGALAMLVCAYAHDPFERRIFTTRASVETILGFCSDHAARVRAIAHEASRAADTRLAVAAALATTPTSFQTIAWENLTLDDSTEHEPGVPIGFRRTGTYRSASLPIFDRYVGTAFATPPRAYAVDLAFAGIVEPLLQAHGIRYSLATSAGVPAGLVVSASQSCGSLLAVLLDPASDDGFVANVLRGMREAGTPAPIVRLMGER
jgi:hypothetical protein